MASQHVFMNLMTDFAFKRLFGTKERKHILITFLNTLFAREGWTVTDVDYHDKEVLPAYGSNKRVVYDVYCTTPGEKEHIILEMQQLHHDMFENRTVYYAARALSSQLSRGDDYDLKPVYTIFLVDFHFGHMSRKGLHDVRLMDTHSHEIYSNVMRLMFVHLADSKDSWGECQTEYDKIVFIIKNMHKMNKESEAYKSGEFEELFQASELSDMVAEDFVAYSNSERKYYDYLAAVSSAARSAREEALEEGMEKGMEKGREEERKDMIRSMYSNGVDINTIAICSNTSVEDIMEILKG